jgi:hypothetical protein
MRVVVFNGDWDACVPYTDGEGWTEGACVITLSLLLLLLSLFVLFTMLFFAFLFLLFATLVLLLQ